MWALNQCPWAQEGFASPSQPHYGDLPSPDCTSFPVLDSALVYSSSAHITLPFWDVSPKTILVTEINNCFQAYSLSTAFCSHTGTFTAPQFSCNYHRKITIALNLIFLCLWLTSGLQKSVCERECVPACVWTRERRTKGGCIVVLLPISPGPKLSI